MKIDANNPPCYVQNVQYGREVYLLLQSSMSSSDLKAHVEGNLTLSNTKNIFESVCRNATNE